MKYCQKCGKQLYDEAVVCPGCGCATNGYTYYHVNTPGGRGDLLTPARALGTLSDRLKLNGILWIVVAVIQILGGLATLWFGLHLLLVPFISAWGVLVSSGVLLLVGILNISTAITDLNNSKRILTDPRGVIKKYGAITFPVVRILYNLFAYWILGAGASLYYFIAVRGYVSSNQRIFEAVDPQGPIA